MANEKILIVDDEPEICDFISIYLKNEGFQTLIAHDGKTALEYIKKENPNLIILDVILPDFDGIATCLELRKSTITPVIFLSCKNEEMDKVIGLTVGGDDYLTKPFSLSELTARVKAQLRRSSIMQNTDFIKKPNLIRYGELVIDIEAYTVTVNEKPVILSAKEFEILTLLARNPNRVFSSDQLFTLAWQEQYIRDSRTIAVHISNIRKKIEQDPDHPEYILTVWGVGYKFNGNLPKHD
ncbi:response regulator transcription factor [Phosphitispora sp. TUW77]|uniref:response regulator transcription factor n=1 Tax=Phosphitispora sp. TUW77 TaxID=3152361 RepID=UPI003AB30DE5